MTGNYADGALPPVLPVLTPADMRETEQRFFARGVPSLLLMEHAAEAVVDALETALGGCGNRRVLFLCGPGNNGGDGLAAARLFAQQGGNAVIWLSGESKTPDAQTNLQWARLSGLETRNLREMPADEEPWGRNPPAFDGFVDALLGTGLRGAPDALTQAMMAYPRRFPGAPVIAVDIPSGMDGRTGETPGDCWVDADVTVTFHAPKPGLYLTQRRESVGRIQVADIGLYSGPDALLREKRELDCRLYTPPALDMLLPRRALNAHKGTAGRVLIYAGSLGMAGAAAMCAKAAIAAGAGLTTIACPREIIPILQALAPAAMCVDIQEAVKQPPAYDVLALGPGLGQSDEIWHNIQALYDPSRPAVWDADALNLLARHPMQLNPVHTVLTPHPGEAARLLGWEMRRVLENRLDAAAALAAQYGAAAVLKGDVTVIAAPREMPEPGLDALSVPSDTPDGQPRFFLNAVGSPALAKGGSGDVLCGIMAALMVQGSFAPPLACLWHGMAGIVGQEKYGLLELTSDQQIACLRDAERWSRGEIPAPPCFRG